MKGQQGMSQPWSRQQSGYNDMQLWQQQLMYKQLQELQKQQQLQQLDQESWQQNSSSQFSSISKQAALDQLPSVVNGMPMCDVPNHTWQSENVGPESRMPSSSQMFVAGNMNWAAQQVGPAGAHRFPNGLMLSQDQGPVFRSTGLVPQQLDQSLYGTPVSSNRTLKQLAQIQGVSNYGADMMAKFVGNPIEKVPMQSGAFNSFDQGLFQGQINIQDSPIASQRFPGKTFFGQLPVQNVSNGIMPENFQQLNALGRGLQAQEFRGGQERADWPGNSREKAVSQVEMVKLDPTEEKLLFSTDDSPWGASFGSGNIETGGTHRNLLEANNYVSAFPSVQSGSWSALMQSAVAETSSGDTGVQDEWSGLSFQQKELSSGNRPSMFVDGGKQQATWAENLQSASSLTSRPFPLFDETDVSSNDRTASVFQHSSFKSTYDHGDEVHAGVPPQSLQQPSKDANDQFDKSQLHNQFLEGNGQAQMHFGVTSGDVWAGQFYEQQVNSVPAEANLSQHNVQGSWAHQQNIPSYNSGAQTQRTHTKMNGWSINESGGDAILKVHDHDSSAQQNQVNCTKGSMHMQRDQDGNMWKANENQKSAPFPHSIGGFGSGKSGIDIPQVQTGDLHMGSFSGINSNNSKANQDENQQLLARHKSDYGKHTYVDSSLKGNEGVGKHQYEANNGLQVWESSHERKKENNIQKGISDDGYTSTNAHAGQPIDSQGFERGRESLHTGSDSHPSASGDQKASDQSVRKNSGPQRFQFHPMGNLGVNVEAQNSKQNFYPQGPSQTAPHGFKSQESGYLGKSQFAGQVASNSMGDTEKQQLFDSPRNVKGSEELHSRGTIFGHDSNIPASLDESAAYFTRNRSSQASQNMLELLHKVDQSRDSGNISSFGFSNHNMISERPDVAASDMPSNLQHSSALQGVGLHLALRSQNSLPSQHQQVLNHALSSKAVLDHNSRHFDSEVEGDKTQMHPTSASLRPLPTMHELSQRENWYYLSGLSGQPHKETSQSSIQTNSTAMTASILPSARHDLQQQPHVSSASGHLATDQSVNVSSGGQLVLDVHNRDPLHIRRLNELQSGDMHDEAVTNQSGQPLLPGVRVSPFGLGSPRDAHMPMGSQPYLNDMGQPRVMSTTSSYPRNSGQFSGPGTPSASQRMAQQGAFSTMLHNVWTNVSAQQRLSGNQSTKPTPSMSASVSSGVLDTNASLSQRAEDQGNKKEQSTASCSTNSQQFTYGEEQTGKDSSMRQIPQQKVDVAPHISGALQVSESLSQHTAVGNSSTTIQSLVRLHQQEIGRAKYEQGLSLDKRAGHASLLNVASSTRDIGSSGHSLKAFDVQHPNYSLLQQVQAMKAIETDPSKRLGKRPKGADSAIGAQQVTGKTPQTYIYGYNTVIRVPPDKELNVSGNQSSFPSDAKMLCFSSEANVDQNIVKTSQLAGKEVNSQVLAGPRNQDVQNHPRSGSITSTSSSVGGTPSRIDPQMAPSWFGQYGNFNNEQTLSMYSGLGGPQKTAKAVAQQYFFSKASENSDAPTSAEKRSDPIRVESIWQSSSTTAIPDEHASLHYASQEAAEHNLIQRPKKRKTATSELLPWHKEIMHGSERLRSLRFERRASISDVKMECQDLEKVSMINRFAKFHGRGQTEGAESSSASESVPRKIFPQRYVTALSMPGSLPEGVFCLSL
ncbi:hypothetical protein Taro_005669 [Colocasia esculenta]|uniref:Uncharacterized protein n=1 Tax=Colocasia esculenta TaxID=4460 RepID=A0A843TNT6_COLES|nr:hypothetical protein [Colocasia esculenta]